MPTIDFVELATFIDRNCTISLSIDHVFITCQTEVGYRSLIRKRKNIQKALNFILGKETSCIHWVTILVGNSKLKSCFSIRTESILMNEIITRSDLPDLVKECLSYEGACGIVRMSDHKGLFSNERIMYSSSALPNDWLGKKMSDYWYPDELNTYIARLVKEGELQSYSYVAKLMDGRPVRLTVNARIIQWHGELARIVKTINREVLV